MTAAALIALAAVAIGGLWSALRFGLWDFGAPGSGLLPAAGCLVMMAGLAAVAWQERARLAPRMSVFSDLRPLVPIGIITAIVPVTLLVGMLPALGLASVAVLTLVESENLWRAGSIALGIAAGAWLLFARLLNVPLPPTPFG